MHHGTCVTHVPWCMSGSLTTGDGENVPGIPGACAPAILRIWQEAHGKTCYDKVLELKHTHNASYWNRLWLNNLITSSDRKFYSDINMLNYINFRNVCSYSFEIITHERSTCKYLICLRSAIFQRLWFAIVYTASENRVLNQRWLGIPDYGLLPDGTKSLAEPMLTCIASRCSVENQPSRTIVNKYDCYQKQGKMNCETCSLVISQHQDRYNDYKTFRERQHPQPAQIRKCEQLSVAISYKDSDPLHGKLHHATKFQAIMWFPKFLLPGPSLSWKISKFRGTGKNWPSMAILSR